MPRSGFSPGARLALLAAACLLSLLDRKSVV